VWENEVTIEGRRKGLFIVNRRNMQERKKRHFPRAKDCIIFN
jgi:hypothetical protein